MIKDKLWGRSSEDSRRESCHLISASERLNPTMFVLTGFWGYTQLSLGWVIWHGMPCWRPHRGGWGNRMLVLWEQASMQSGLSIPQCSRCWNKGNLRRVLLAQFEGWQFSRESMRTRVRAGWSLWVCGHDVERNEFWGSSDFVLFLSSLSLGLSFIWWAHTFVVGLPSAVKPVCKSKTHRVETSRWLQKPAKLATEINHHKPGSTKYSPKSQHGLWAVF